MKDYLICQNELRGTWYLANESDGSVSKLIIDKNTITGEGFIEKLHKMNKNFDFTSYAQNHPSYQDMTKDWARVVVYLKMAKVKLTFVVGCKVLELENIII